VVVHREVLGLELSDLIKHAWEDADFKRMLLEDPRTTIEETLDVTLPPGLNIYIHEQTLTDLHLILPMPPDPAPSASG
jgi:hypothetical protein